MHLRCHRNIAAWKMAKSVYKGFYTPIAMRFFYTPIDIACEFKKVISFGAKPKLC